MTNDEERELKEAIANLRREMDLRWEFQGRLEEQFRQMTDRTASQMEERLKGMNEFREQLRVQASSFFLRAEHEQFAARVEQQFTNLSQKLDAIQSRQDQDAGRRTVLTAIGTAAITFLTGSMVGLLLLILNNASRLGH